LPGSRDRRQMAATVSSANPTAAELLRRVEAGSATQSDVEAWVKVAAGRNGTPDRIERVDALQTAIREACHAAVSSPDRIRALAVLAAARTMADLHPVPGYRAVVSVNLAAYLATMGRDDEALQYWEEAVDGFQSLDGAPWQELISLKQWIDALRRQDRFHDAADVAERMVTRAVALEDRPAELTARYLRGLLRNRIGRDGALEDFASARVMNPSIEAADREQYEVPSEESLISTLGVAARAAGDYELSMKTLDDLVELARHHADRSLEAEGWSELGYTHEAFGEIERAVVALTKAADIGDAVGDARARRWRRQARAVAGEIDDTDSEYLATLVGPITDVADAYERSSVMESLARSNRFSEALALSDSVLEWSRAEGVVDLEMSASGLVSIALARTGGDLRQAVKLSHKAIRMAEQRRNYGAALRFRENLALVFRLNDQLQEAVDTLQAAIGNGDILLRETRGSGARQRLAAGLLGVTSALAGLYSRSDHHQHMIAVTERARTRNLEEWMRMAAAFASSNDSGAGQASMARLLTAEVELEVRQLQGPVTGAELVALTDRRDEAIASATRALATAGDVAVQEPAGIMAPDVPEHLASVLEPGRAILFLFEAAEGVCAAVAYLDGSRLRYRGGFVPWDVNARHTDLQSWTALTNARSAGQLRGQSISVLTDPITTSFYEPAAAIVRQAAPRDLIVIPQGDLALLPYWELLRLVGADGMLGIVPSLDVLRLCAARHRDSTGATLIVGDSTKTLSHAKSEIRFVRDARGNEVHETTIAQEIIDNASGANAVHVAAHGIFNPTNPYLGGILVGEGPGDHSRFVQYVANGPRFSATRERGATRLLTVAECMTGLSLGACRMAVLSACESGVASIHGGGELTGLPNAFLLAGAQSVVASLWRVDDAATATLMHHFYDAFSGGPEDVPVAKALSEARDRLASSTRKDIVQILGVDQRRLPSGNRPFDHPYYTDAFQCYGSF
jgi:tetratricopeptide (TPR) repeat protein